MSTRQINHIFPTLVGEVRAGAAPVKPNIDRSLYTVKIVSTIREQIFWKNAYGIIMHEPPHASPTDEERVLFEIEYHFNRGGRVDGRGLLNEALESIYHVEKEQMKKVIEGFSVCDQYMYQNKFVFTLAITRKKIEENGGVVYLNDLDLVVGFSTLAETAFHSFSAGGQSKELSRYMQRYAGFQQRYLLVDNSKKGGPLWVNTGYGIFKLTPQTDPSMYDGVYVSTSNGITDEIKTERFDIPEAEKALGLYRSYAEAEAFGAPDKRFQMDLKELEKKVLHKKAEMEQEKAEFESKRRIEEERIKEQDREWEEKQARWKRQEEELRMQRDHLDEMRRQHNERVKFENEQASRSRKDSSEVLKWVLDTLKLVIGIISVGLSIFAVAQKAKA